MFKKKNNKTSKNQRAGFAANTETLEKIEAIALYAISLTTHRHDLLIGHGALKS
ncbi:MAG TPA: hypothetical protein VF679_11285 [Pedobacter sp.]